MKYNVLIADDNMDVQNYLTNYTNWQEYEMKISKVASTGHEAIDYLKSNHVDAAIIDLNIQGINGIEIIREIKQMGLKTYPIVMGGYKSKKYITRALEIGAKDVIYKNIDEKSLNSALLKSYYHIKSHTDKRETIPHATMSLLNLIVNKEESIESGAKNIFTDLMNLKTKDGEENQIAVDFWKDFWKIAKKKYGWLENIFNFYKYENYSWQDVSNVAELEREFLHVADTFGALVRKFDICEEDGRVREICACIIREVENEVRLESVAKEMNYSKNHICTLFKQKSGNSFIDYVNLVKIERAKDRLENSTLRNYEVGQLVGFKNTDYFMRVFKTAVGMTPGDYRIYARKKERNRSLSRNK